jgi:hypothetical protein
MAVAQAPAQAYNPLFLYGETGLGKTHLMHAAGNLMRQLNPGMRVLYLRSEQFFTAMMKALQEKSMDQFKRQFHTVDALLIDNALQGLGLVGSDRLDAPADDLEHEPPRAHDLLDLAARRLDLERSGFVFGAERVLLPARSEPVSQDKHRRPRDRAEREQEVHEHVWPGSHRHGTRAPTRGRWPDAITTRARELAAGVEARTCIPIGDASDGAAAGQAVDGRVHATAC